MNYFKPLILVLLISFSSCKKDPPIAEIPIQQECKMEYEGTSNHWNTQPNNNTMLTTNYTQNVHVQVIECKSDSTKDLIITYNDTTINTLNNISFSPTGEYYSEWGAGSSYGDLWIYIDENTFTYRLFQKCGIPCSSGIRFTIPKK